ncbi:MAG: AEC family transporter [Thermodesulfobacteriota bacterium]
MITVFLSLAAIALVGSMLRHILPGVDIDGFRKNINRLVLFTILPALIFNVVYRAEIGKDFILVPLSAATGILSALALALAAFRFLPLQNRTKGALILGSAFSNVTYLGLPVLMGVFSAIPDKIAVVSVLYEVTTSPLLLSVGVFIAVWFGKKRSYGPFDYVKRICKLPPLWALGIVLAVKLLSVPVPAFLLQACKTLSAAAAGLMILSLGMALRFKRIEHLKPIAISVVLQLAFLPFVVFHTGRLVGLTGPFYEAAVIEAAMPTQLLTLVVADEFDLDTEALAQTIFITTVLSLGTIPLVRHILFP